MTPQPLDGAVAGPSPSQLDQPQDGPRPGSISLTMLIEFIIQRTYHDLTVLAELLPRKTDMERKIEIYNFSARTRQLFIRLLALVKWASSASKVDKSANIMTFLDKQSMLFVDTADALSRLSRETMVNARLPNFNIPAAIEVLTTGTYSRLPTCIRERILPIEPLSIVEKKQTMHRLNQIIQHRLVIGNLPMQMRNFKIDNGRVQFRVDNEFEVGLTLMSDLASVPWRLLEIDILVTDTETANGKELVHIMQIGYIHQLIQARLVDNAEALTEVYNCLHSFCQSLQLEVLFSQTMHLKQHRLNDNVHVEEYVPGAKLSVSYWRELSNKDPRSELGYQLTVQTDPADAARPLAVFHRPSIGSKESSDMADSAVRAETLSMERLLVHTVYIRSLARLADIKSEFLKFMINDADFTLQGTPAVLTLPVLQPCLPAAQLHVSVDTHTGTLRCHVPQHLDCPVLVELQAALNGDHSKIATLVGDLRIWMAKRRCERTLSGLAAEPFERLPLRFEPTHPVTRLGQHRLYVRLNRHPSVILIVEINECPTSQCKVVFAFYLAFVKQCTVDEDVDAAIDAAPLSDLPKVFYRLTTMVEFDSFVATHGPATDVYDPPTKKAKTSFPPYSVPELAHVVSMCDEKLPFLALANELSDRSICHSGVQCEIEATTTVLRILVLPQPPSLHAPPDACLSPLAWRSLHRRLLSASIRSQVNKNLHSKSWSFELIFFDAPLHSNCTRELSKRRRVCFTYNMDSTVDIAHTVDAMLRDWSSIVYLYRLCREFVCYYDDSPSKSPNSSGAHIRNMATIKSYSYTNLVLGYGTNHEITVDISWNKEFRLVFTGAGAGFNAHSMMAQHLEAQLNASHSLAELVRTLHDTYYALTSIARLSIIPHLGIPRPQVPVLSFCILPQSACLLRIAYQAMYCLEIRICSGGLVSIRDGAHTHFNKTSTVDEFTPTQGLKSFLLNYVDESVVHCRRLQWDDESPPSPSVVDEAALRPLRSQSPRITTNNSTAPGSPITQQPIPNSVVSPKNTINHTQPLTEKSPLNVNSPATAPNWPGSPSVARPSPRPDEKPVAEASTPVDPKTPVRSWTTSSVPTMLTCEALETLCFPSPNPQPEVPGPDMCPLERFLGCVYMRRNLQRFIQSEDHLNAIKCGTPGVVMFTVDSIQCRIALNTDHMQSLQIQVTQAPITAETTTKSPVQWSIDELRTIEEFFEQRVASPPYRPCSLYGFCRMLKVPPQVIRDFIQIIRLELQPELLPDSQWQIQFLVRVPPSSPPIVPTGSAAIHMLRMKTLFFLQIIQVSPQLDQEPVSLVLPMVYDVTSNITQLAERRETSGVVPSPTTNAVSTLLRRFAETHAANSNGTDVCSIYPAVREILLNLVLPTTTGQAAQQVPQAAISTVVTSNPSGPMTTTISKSSASDTNANTPAINADS